MAEFWLAKLDDELHDCHPPEMRRGRVYTCECGCIWECGRMSGTLRWMLTRDPDRVKGS